MRRLNKKGFTLIELLAVIVILGVLLAIAVPSVSKYISVSKRSTYAHNAKSYVEAVRNESMVNTYQFPVNAGDATVITFDEIAKSMEKGGKTSPYGGKFDLNSSFVVIVNEGTAEVPHPKYYIAAIDTNGYGIGVTNADGTVSAQAIEYDELDNDNILQLGTGLNVPTEGATTVSGISTLTKVTNKYPK